MNIQKMMQQAQELQKKMSEAQAKLAEEENEGDAGGGMVKVTLNGKGNLLKLHIDDSLMNKDEKDVLEDLIIAAYNDAKKKVEDNFSSQMESITGGLGLPAGMKMPF